MAAGCLPANAMTTGATASNTSASQGNASDHRALSSAETSRAMVVGEVVPRSGCLICTCVHILPVVVEWDREKAAANRSKHGVDFADAATVLTDDFALTRRDETPDEERFVTVGMDAMGRVVTVIFAWRGETVRLISARRATASERRQYEKNR